jgi:hypothetical protein
MFPCQRDIFKVNGDIAYLSCAYMGPMSLRPWAADKATMARKRLS